MFKKLCLLLLLSSIVAASMQAQKAKLILSPEMKPEKGFYFNRHLYSDESGHYLLLSSFYAGLGGNMRKVSLEKYDLKWKRVARTPFESKDKEIGYDNVFYMNGGFMFCMEKENTSKNTYALDVMRVSLDGQTSKPQTIYSETYKRRMDLPSHSWHVSNDSTKVLLKLTPDVELKEKQKCDLRVIDSEGNLLWKKKITFPYIKKDMSVFEWKIDNAGNVYMLVRVKADESERPKGAKWKSAYRYEIIRYSADDEAGGTTYKLDLNGGFVVSLGLRIDAQEYLHCIGFYSEERYGDIKGIFYTRINGDNGEVEHANKHAFTAKDLSSMGDDDKDEGKDGSADIDRDFTFRYILPQPDGSLIVSAEQYFITVTTTGTGNSRSSTTYYHAYEIFNFRISPEGDIMWLNVIPKRQIQANSNTLISYACMTTKDGNSYFFYNDDEDNISKPLTARPRKISSFKDIVTAIVSLTPEGQAERKSLTEARALKQVLIPSNCRQINDSEMFIRIINPRLFSANTFRFGVVQLE